MRVNKAINILKIQRTKLDDFGNRNQNWVFQTASYIKEFFGEQSTEFSFISQFHFHVISSNWDDPNDVRRWLAEKPIEAKTFLDNCIETLRHKGLFQQPRQNFLNQLSDTAIWTIISIAIPGLISIGLFFGKLYADNQNIEIRQENKLLRDSLSERKDAASQKNDKGPDTSNSKSVSIDTTRPRK